MTWSGQVIYYQEVNIMLITNISDAKAQFSYLIEKVRAGEDVIIGKAGKPIARPVKYEQQEVQRQPGAFRGKIKIEEDFDECPMI
jgi:prevent-host-death family protein